MRPASLSLKPSLLGVPHNSKQGYINRKINMNSNAFCRETFGSLTGLIMSGGLFYG